MKKKEFLRYLPPLLLTAAGLAGGYLYYRLVGCTTGSCAITSNPYISTVYGGIMGMLIGVILMPKRKKDGDGEQ